MARGPVCWLALVWSLWVGLRLERLVLRLERLVQRLERPALLSVQQAAWSRSVELGSLWALVLRHNWLQLLCQD